MTASKAEPGGSAAQRQRPRRSTDRPACERRPARPGWCQQVAVRRGCPTSSSTILFTAGLERKRISLALVRAGMAQDQSAEPYEGYRCGQPAIRSMSHTPLSRPLPVFDVGLAREERRRLRPNNGRECHEKPRSASLEKLSQRLPNKSQTIRINTRRPPIPPPTMGPP